MWEMDDFYLDAERQFLEFNSIIPLNKNPIEKIYSPRFLSIIQSICSQVDSVFQILIKELSLKPQSRTFPNYYKILNKQKMLSFQRTYLQINHSYIQPFKDMHPQWWEVYNKTKHNLPSGAYEVKYRHIIDSLAALYILHNLAMIREIYTDPAIDLPDYTRKVSTFLDVKNWRDEERDRVKGLPNNNTDSFHVKSKIFSRTTYFWPQDNDKKKLN